MGRWFSPPGCSPGGAELPSSSATAPSASGLSAGVLVSVDPTALPTALPGSI